MLLLTAGFLVYNLPNLTIPLALHTVFRKIETPAALVRLLIAYLIAHGAFAIRYSITDQYTFLFPTYFILAALACIGLADVQRIWPATVSISTPDIKESSKRGGFGRFVTIVALLTALWPPLIYEIAYRVLSSQNALGSMIATKPYRDGYAAMLLPWGDRGGYVQKTNDAAFALSGPDGVILVGDEMFEHALRIHQRLNPAFERVHFEFLNEVRAANGWDDLRKRVAVWLTTGKAVILVPRDRSKPTIEPLKGRWTRSGDLYKLEGLEE